jgi:hypothetical protein
MKLTLCAIVAISLTACTTMWDRPGLTDAEWRQDTYACELASMGVPSPTPVYAPNPGAPGWAGVQQQGAALVVSGQNLGQRAQQIRLFEMCMEARGYSKVR